MQNTPYHERIHSDESPLHIEKRRSFIRHFFSFRARMKSLFPASLYRSCDCSCSSKQRKKLSEDPSLIDSVINIDEEKEVLDYKYENDSDHLVGSGSSPDFISSIIANVPRKSIDEIHATENEIFHLQEMDFSDLIPSHEYDSQQQSKFLFISDSYNICDTFEITVSNEPLSSEFISKKDFVSDFGDSSIEQPIRDLNIRKTESMEEFGSFSPTTITSKLYNQLRNGEISYEEHKNLLESVIISVIPRNLSDTIETRHQTEAIKMCSDPPRSVTEFDEEDSNMLMNKLSITEPANNQLSATTDSINDYLYSRTFIEDIIYESIQYILHERDGRTENSHRVGISNVPMIVETPDLNSTDEIKTKNLEPDSKNDHNENNQPDDSVVTKIKSKFEEYCLNLPAKFYDSSSDADYQQSNDYFDNRRSKRSSSLKSESSPINTPFRKIVRFADALGLDLATVRQVLDQENPPKIPASATSDLHLDSEKSFSSIGAKQFQVCFSQPSSSSNFLHRVLQDAVSLENARVDSSRGLLTGAIRVRSFGFEKHVSVRISYNNWNTFCEVTASYIQDSHDGATDRFSFSAIFPSTVVAGESIQFAIRYENHKGEIFWDSNHGGNYIVSCYAKATDMAGDGSWLHFL